MTTDPRLAKNQASVKNLEVLLKAIIEHPRGYMNNDQIRTALKSQGSMSKLTLNFIYESLERPISPSSTNTVKRVANGIFEDGFNHLDSLRIRAKTILEETARQDLTPKPSSKVKLSNQIQELQELLQISRQDCWNLAAAFRKACDHARRYAEATGDKTAIDKCTKELKELKAMLSLLKDPTSSN